MSRTTTFNVDAIKEELMEATFRRAYISKHCDILHDSCAEAVAAVIEEANARKKVNVNLAIFQAGRSKVMDDLTQRYIFDNPDCSVVHLGCGLDARYFRMKNKPSIWYDVDIDGVIDFRKAFFRETDTYKMVSADITDRDWLNKVENAEKALIIAEAVVMFLDYEENCSLLEALKRKYPSSVYVFDSYASRVIPDYGANTPVQRGRTILFGMGNPRQFEAEGIKYDGYYSFNKPRGLNSVDLFHRAIYWATYSRSSVKKVYSIYQYSLGTVSGDKQSTGAD